MPLLLRFSKMQLTEKLTDLGSFYCCYWKTMSNHGGMHCSYSQGRTTQSRNYKRLNPHAKSGDTTLVRTTASSLVSAACLWGGKGGGSDSKFVLYFSSRLAPESRDFRWLNSLVTRCFVKPCV